MIYTSLISRNRNELFAFFALLISAIFANTAQAAVEPVLINVVNDAGQAIAITRSGSCYVVTDQHVVSVPTVDGEILAAPALDVIGTHGTHAKASAVFIENSTLARIMFNDVENEHSVCWFGGGPVSEIPQTGSYLIRRLASGELDPTEIVIVERSAALLLVRVSKESESLLQSYSGSAVFDDGAFVGMVVEVTEDGLEGSGPSVRAIETQLEPAIGPAILFDLRVAELNWAAYDAREQDVYRLLDDGVDVNQTDDSGLLPLERAATVYNNFYRYTARNGVDIGDESERQTACARWMDTKIRILEEMLEHGARVNGYGDGTWTPLMSAVSDADSICPAERIVEFLLNHGADPNIERRYVYGAGTASEKILAYSALWLAVEDGKSGVLRELLETNLDNVSRNDVFLDERNERGQTALIYLAMHPYPEEDDDGWGGRYSGCIDRDSTTLEDLFDGTAELVNNSNANKMMYLLQAGANALLRTPSDFSWWQLPGDWSNMTAREILEARLGGGCNTPACDGSGRAGVGRCLERMLWVLDQYE